MISYVSWSHTSHKYLTVEIQNNNQGHYCEGEGFQSDNGAHKCPADRAWSQRLPVIFRIIKLQSFITKHHEIYTLKIAKENNPQQSKIW